MNDDLMARRRRRRPFVPSAALVATALLAALTITLGSGPFNDANAATTPEVQRALLAQRHAEAVRALQSGRYAVAYAGFARLADEGHAPSAAVALLMVSHGASLFGSAWSATPGQLQRWNAMAQQDLREHAAVLTDHDRGE